MISSLVFVCAVHLLPNLGRPNDHFQITPFEAIYVDNKINPHIKLKEDDEDDLAMLNNFILNEVEPWYLGLQNYFKFKRFFTKFGFSSFII